MSLQTRISDLITAVGTDYKQLRTWISGSSTGTLTGLTTTDKTSIVNAINEVKAGNTGSPPDASETVKGIAEVATQTEVTTGTDDTRIITPLKLATRLTGIAAQPDATEAVKGIVELATQTEVTTGTDDVRVITPLKLATRLSGLAAPADASETVKGIIELATTVEAVAGTDAVRGVTPAGIAAVFLDRIDTTVSLGASNVKVPSQAAVKAYADGIIAAADAMVFKGIIDASTNPNYPASNRGETHRISVAGKIGGASGPNVEVGDILMALTDGTAAGTHAAVGAQWTIVQTNLDGAVIGPVSSVASNLATFSGTTGKLIQDSGFSTDSDGTLTANSATRLPTQSAVKTYADTKQPLDSDLTSIAALTTTAYGRAFLVLADQAALMALLAAASETVAGKIEIATQVEMTTGTDDVRAVTPLKHRTDLNTVFGNAETDLVALYTTAKA